MGNTLDGERAVSKPDLASFLRFVIQSMNSPAVPHEHLHAKATELMAKLVQRLPAEASAYTLADLLKGAESLIEYPQPTVDDLANERGRLGSKQLRKLRSMLERNRVTMPLFDSQGWVRDFEKALKIQWEIYANGLLPMHIVVGRSDHLY